MDEKKISSKLLVMCPLDMLEIFCWCVMYPISEGKKWVTKIELRISKSQEAFPHLFFLLGEEGELWGVFFGF